MTAKYRFDMDTRRSINVRIWADSWIEELTLTEKLVWIYLLTAPYSNMLGIYEVSIKRISSDTGVNIEMVRKALEGFEKVKKAYYIDGFIFICNWIKNQSMNPNMVKSAINDFAKLPESLKIKLNDIGYESFESLSNPSEPLPNPSEKGKGKGNGNIEMEKEKEKENARREIHLSLWGDYFERIENAWDKWIQYRAAIKKPIKNESESAAIKHLHKLSSGNIGNAEKIIEQSIANGWQGLFPYRQTYNELPDNGLKKVYEDWYREKLNVPYKFSSGDDSKAVNEISAYIREATIERGNSDPSQSEIENTFLLILRSFDKWDSFYQDQLKLSQINSNLPNILANIKGIKNGKATSVNYAEIGNQIREAYKQH